MRDYAQSAAWYRRAIAVCQGGAHTASKAPGRVGPLGAYPLYLAKAHGAHVWDVDGHQYVDWFNGNCAVVLGHQPGPAIAPLPSLPSTLEVEVAEQLVEAIPCADAARFVKTGSEACAAAVRIARMATGRTKIAIIPGGYHGWHDWAQALKPSHPGVPDFYQQGLVAFERSIDSLEAVLDQDVAAVMIEPVDYTHANPAETAAFLENLKTLAHANGSLVVWDDMISGGRYALAGGQELFDVTPDLATFGKALANGAAFACVCGSADLMRHTWAISGTFCGEQLGLASCLATLEAHRTTDVIGRLWATGQALMDGLREVLTLTSAPADLVGYPCRPILQWRGDDANLLSSLCQQELAARGVICHPSGWNPSAAHSAADVRETIRAFAAAMQVVTEAIATDRVRDQLRGDPIQAAFVARTA